MADDFKILDTDLKIHRNNWWMAILACIIGITSFLPVASFQFEIYVITTTSRYAEYFSDNQQPLPSVYAFGLGNRMLTLALILLSWYLGRKYSGKSQIWSFIKWIGYIFSIIALLMLFIPFYSVFN